MAVEDFVEVLGQFVIAVDVSHLQLVEEPFLLLIEGLLGLPALSAAGGPPRGPLAALGVVLAAAAHACNVYGCRMLRRRWEETVAAMAAGQPMLRGGCCEGRQLSSKSSIRGALDAQTVLEASTPDQMPQLQSGYADLDQKI